MTPKTSCTENTKNSTQREYIVKMSYNIVCIMQCQIKSSITQDNTSNTPYSKQKQKSQHPQTNRCPNCWRPNKPSKSPKYLNTSRYSNNHCGTCKICSCIHIHTYSKHMMSSHYTPQKSNTHDSINHP